MKYFGYLTYTKPVKTRELFEWKLEHDQVLLREVNMEEPYNNKSGSKERGATWTRISDLLNSMTSFGFRVKQRSVQEGFDKMMKEFDKMEKDQSRPSGVDVDFDEKTQALTDIKERIKEAEELFCQEDNKGEKEKTATEEMGLKVERLKKD